MEFLGKDPRRMIAGQGVAQAAWATPRLRDRNLSEAPNLAAVDLPSSSGQRITVFPVVKSIPSKTRGTKQSSCRWTSWNPLFVARSSLQGCGCTVCHMTHPARMGAAQVPQRKALRSPESKGSSQMFTMHGS